MEVIEERINDLKGRSIEIIKTELQREKDWGKKKKEEILRDLWENTKKSNTHVI